MCTKCHVFQTRPCPLIFLIPLWRKQFLTLAQKSISANANVRKNNQTLWLVRVTSSCQLKVAEHLDLGFPILKERTFIECFPTSPTSNLEAIWHWDYSKGVWSTATNLFVTQMDLWLTEKAGSRMDQGNPFQHMSFSHHHHHHTTPWYFSEIDITWYFFPMGI